MQSRNTETIYKERGQFKVSDRDKLCGAEITKVDYLSTQKFKKKVQMHL